MPQFAILVLQQVSISLFSFRAGRSLIHHPRGCRAIDHRTIDDTFLGERARLCGMLGLGLGAGSSTLLRPREVRDGDDEEAVRCIGDTGQGVVPGQERGQDTKGTSSAGQADMGFAAGRRVEVGDAEEEEGQVQGEEQQEEGDGGFQRAEQEDRGEDEPALRR